MAYRPFGDCLEFYGGTVSVKRALCIGGEDDSFDWKDGWRGKAQFIIIMQDGDNPAQADDGTRGLAMRNIGIHAPRGTTTAHRSTTSTRQSWAASGSS